MEYARRIMQESSLTLNEAARTVGYRSTHNFITMLRKYNTLSSAPQERLANILPLPCSAEAS